MSEAHIETVEIYPKPSQENVRDIILNDQDNLEVGLKTLSKLTDVDGYKEIFSGCENLEDILSKSEKMLAIFSKVTEKQNEIFEKEDEWTKGTRYMYKNYENPDYQQLLNYVIEVDNTYKQTAAEYYIRYKSKEIAREALENQFGNYSIPESMEKEISEIYHEFTEDMRFLMIGSGVLNWINENEVEKLIENGKDRPLEDNVGAQMEGVFSSFHNAKEGLISSLHNKDYLKCRAARYIASRLVGNSTEEAKDIAFNIVNENIRNEDGSSEEEKIKYFAYANYNKKNHPGRGLKLHIYVRGENDVDFLNIIDAVNSTCGEHTSWKTRIPDLRDFTQKHERLDPTHITIYPAISEPDNSVLSNLESTIEIYTTLEENLVSRGIKKFKEPSPTHTDAALIKRDSSTNRVSLRYGGISSNADEVEWEGGWEDSREKGFEENLPSSVSSKEIEQAFKERDADLIK